MIALVVAAHRPRLAELTAFLDQVERTAGPGGEEIVPIIVTTEPYPITPRDLVLMGRDSPRLGEAALVPTGSNQMNLQRWFNLGVRHALHLGARHIAWAESDTRVHLGHYSELSRVLDQRPDISYVHGNYAGAWRRNAAGLTVVKRRGRNFRRMLWGMWRAAETVWADEEYTWWCGIEDMEARRLADGQRLAVVPRLRLTSPGNLWFDMPEHLHAAVRADRDRYLSLHGDPFPFDFRILVNGIDMTDLVLAALDEQ